LNRYKIITSSNKTIW